MAIFLPRIKSKERCLESFAIVAGGIEIKTVVSEVNSGYALVSWKHRTPYTGNVIAGHKFPTKWNKLPAMKDNFFFKNPIFVSHLLGQYLKNHKCTTLTKLIYFENCASN